MFQSEDLMFSDMQNEAIDTQKEAIKEGSLTQICVSDDFPQETKMYGIPVFFTKAVWELCQGKSKIIYNICYVAGWAYKAEKIESFAINYSVIVEGATRQPDFTDDNLPFYHLLAELQVKYVDDSTPFITFMFPEEH